MSRTTYFGGYELHPTEEITAFELAQIMSITTMDKKKQSELVEKLPIQTRRYLRAFNVDVETGERLY